MRLFDMDSREDYLLDGKYKVATPYAPCVDIVEVIRCKDCNYRTEDGECDCNSLYMNMEGDLIGVEFVPEKDFYCKYGKRREDGNA